MKTRPFKFNDADELQKLIDDYFFECDEEGVKMIKVSSGKLVEYVVKKPYTIEGLGCALGIDRTTVWRYAKGKINPDDGRICNIIKEAVLKIGARHIESGLLGVYEPRFAQFIAECALGYGKEKEDDKEKTEREQYERIIVLEKLLKQAKDAKEKSWPKPEDE